MMLFSLIKKIKELNINVAINDNLTDKIYQLQTEKIII